MWPWSWCIRSLVRWGRKVPRITASISVRPAWDSIQGRIVKVNGMQGISWYIPLQSAKPTIRVISLPIGSASELSYSSLTNWISNGSVEVFPQHYLSWDDAMMQQGVTCQA